MHDAVATPKREMRVGDLIRDLDGSTCRVTRVDAGGVQWRRLYWYEHVTRFVLTRRAQKRRARSR